MIGDPAVRHMGTIGGSVANNDPTADYPAACLALGATIITNKRRIKADDFFTGMFSTALEPAEIITKVSFPLPKKAAYQKFRNQASRYALVGVFVAKRGSENASRSPAPVPRRVPRHRVRGGAEEALLAEIARGADGAGAGLNSDIHGSAEYRAHLIARARPPAVRGSGSRPSTASTNRHARLAPDRCLYMQQCRPEDADCRRQARQ